MIKNYKTSLIGLLLIFIASAGLYLGKLNGVEFGAIVSTALGLLYSKDYDNRKSD